MLAEQFLRRREQQGREQGREEVQKAWEDWYARRAQFEADHPGQTFPEAPPELGNRKK